MVLKAGPSASSDDDAWRRDWRRNPFLPIPEGHLLPVIERFEEEWETFKWMCPYCGQRNPGGHMLEKHPEMWVGGPNAYGTDFHGWADH